MTPEQLKAKELIDKFSTYVVMWAGGIETELQNVRQCAIFICEEVIKENDTIANKLTNLGMWSYCDSIEISKQTEFWKRVIVEINNYKH